MQFEGSEKKAKVLIQRDKISLLNDIEDEFWRELVSCCGAHILSSMSNPYCKAFLLSESSLFVWDDHFLILTCGETRLVNAVEYFINKHGTAVIKHVNYQRKNEYFAHAQPSSFGDDIRLLSQYLTGSAYRFGELDSHHNYLYQHNNQFTAPPENKTYELLASQISKQASAMLTSPGISAKEIRKFLRLSDWLPEFALDDFVFDPFGYSVNAIKDKSYLTIHVTPQEGSSYVSFESNINLISLAEIILTVLQPASFVLLTFNEFDCDQQVNHSIPEEYICKAKVAETLDNDSLICFNHFIRPVHKYSKPTMLDLSRDNNAL